MLNIYYAYGWPWKGQQRHYAIIHTSGKLQSKEELQEIL
jgi:hypothetical protein